MDASIRCFLIRCASWHVVIVCTLLRIVDTWADSANQDSHSDRHLNEEMGRQAYWPTDDRRKSMTHGESCSQADRLSMYVLVYPSLSLPIYPSIPIWTFQRKLRSGTRYRKGHIPSLCPVFLSSAFFSGGMHQLTRNSALVLSIPIYPPRYLFFYLLLSPLADGQEANEKHVGRRTKRHGDRHACCSIKYWLPSCWCTIKSK